MKGKKIDNEFISTFITESIAQGINTPEGIVKSAKTIVEQIDEEIKRVEQQKIRRSKLLDVIYTFEKSEKNPKSEEIKALSYFKIEQPQICYYICCFLKEGPITITELGLQHSVADLIFCIKQLIEHKVISKSGEYLLRGECFYDYLKFVFKESNEK